MSEAAVIRNCHVHADGEAGPGAYVVRPRTSKSITFKNCDFGAHLSSQEDRDV